MKTLGKLKLKEEKMLSSEELVNIRGGSGTCAAYRPAGSYPTSGGSYSGSSMNYNNGNYTYYGVSRAEAQWLVSGGGYWCCDSCGSASWY